MTDTMSLKLELKFPRAKLPHHQGKCFLDMPGAGEDDKRINFALFRRGKLRLDYINATPQKRAAMNGYGYKAAAKV